jgi:hypothetical protein
MVTRPALMLALILARLAAGSCAARYASSRTLPCTTAARRQQQQQQQQQQH